MSYPPDQSYVFPKKYTCPICGGEFTAPTIKSSKVRTVRTDFDLRPVQEGIKAIKYDVVLCSKCGYTALERYFKNELKPYQKAEIRLKITSSFKPRLIGETLSFEDAFYRYQMNWINTMVKEAGESEKAYVALKMAWFLRGWKEFLDENDMEYKSAETYINQEENYLRMALDGFEKAIMSEEYPIAGMDEPTLFFLMAALHKHFEEYEAAIKLLSLIITNRGASSRVKEKAKDLKEEIAAAQK